MDTAGPQSPHLKDEWLEKFNGIQMLFFFQSSNTYLRRGTISEAGDSGPV